MLKKTCKSLRIPFSGANAAVSYPPLQLALRPEVRKLMIRPGKGHFSEQRRGKESSEKFVIWKSYYKFAICFVWDG